jgi:hypothetical protein
VAMDLARKVSGDRAAVTAGGISEGGLESGEDISSAPASQPTPTSFSCQTAKDVFRATDWKKTC